MTMLKKTSIQLLAFLLAMSLGIFGLGALLTGPAPSAVGTLSVDLPVETITISTTQGTEVHGWLAHGRPGNAAILLVHSMRSNRLEMLSRAKFLHAAGYHVLMIDLHAHGETAGDRITFGARESESVVAAVHFLRNTYPHERLGAIGASLGAAALMLAPQNLKLDAVILESLHPTFEEAVHNRLKLHLGEHASFLLPVMLSQLSFYTGSTVNRLNPIDKIDELHSPVLFIAGTQDAHTTQSESERLYNAARSPKEIWIVPGAGHFNMHNYAGKEYERHVLAFLAQHLRRDAQ